MVELTLKEQRFVDEYLIDGNGARAIAAAGYSQSNAYQAAFKLLRKPYIAREVADRRLAISTKLQIKQEDIVREAARLAFSDIRNVAEFGADIGVRFLDSIELSDDAARSISEITSAVTYRPGKKDEGVMVEKRRVKMYDKIAALNLLAKILGYTQSTTNIGTQQNLVLPSGTTIDDLKALRDDLKNATDA